jgi:predicted acylesterase/phospholipase RssA
LVAVPADTPDDLVDRYRQLRVFEEAEVALVRATLDRPDRLARTHEQILRQALSFARVWIVPGDNGSQSDLVVGPLLGSLRDRVRGVAEALVKNGTPDVAQLAREAELLAPVLAESRESLLSRHPGRLLSSALDREIGAKSLVLVLGGGGGCGYVHLGSFSVLESIGIVPKLVVGSSMGSVLGLFRTREIHYRDATVRAVTHGLTFKKLFRVLEGEPRYGLPGTLRLYLRSAISRFFVSGSGEAMRMGDLAIPFICTVTGIRREALRRDIRDYEAAFARELRRGAFGALLHLKDLIQSWASLMSDLIVSGGMRSIALGLDNDTREFDVLDAVGFSCSVPALIHYDILRDDPRMHEMMKTTLRRYAVDLFIDGGIASNVPARAAWEAVQRGRIGTRNALILGMDCFAPNLRRNMLFLPLMRLAAENVARDRPFAHHVFTYRKVLSPAALVPNARVLANAIANGRTDFEALAPFVRKMLEPLPSIRG